MKLIKPGERLDAEHLSKYKEIFNNDTNPVKYLGIDPGRSNGICGYDIKYYLMFMFTIHSDDMTLFMHCFDNVDTCVMESFRLFPNKVREQTYSDMETSRVIGRVESWVELKKVDLVTQSPSIKVTGYKWIGKKPLPKSNPSNHEMDAHVHFMYWAIRTGRIAAADVLRKI